MEKKIFGITGCIGAGKSAVAKILEEKGYYVIQTDALAKQIIAEDNSVQKKTTLCFGDNAFIDGKYNSNYIADITFNNSNKLNALNQIIFPVVIEKLLQIIDQLQLDTSIKDNIIFIETALLFEFQLEEGFDYTISVSAPLETRIQWLQTNRYLSREDIIRRMDSQMPQEEKNKKADFVIDNSKDLIQLEQSVSKLLSILKILPNKM